jgi:hypothetical protein
MYYFGYEGSFNWWDSMWYIYIVTVNSGGPGIGHEVGIGHGAGIGHGLGAGGGKLSIHSLYIY